MAKIRRTLFIGLGGTGMTALVKTKKMLYNNYGEIPPMVGFLGLDTDGGKYAYTEKANDGKEIGLDTSEQLPLMVETPMTIYRTTPSAFDWIPDGNEEDLTELIIGAGATRSNGRFAVTLHEEDVRNRIREAMNTINAASTINNTKYSLLSLNTEIHIVFSLGGGTGCGTFLNISYLLHDLYGETTKVSGYALMADVFRSVVQGAASARVKPNAYGALLDLDYLISEVSVKNPVEFSWSRTKQRVDGRPFTALYLIDNRNSANYTFTDTLPLCDMISMALVTSLGELSVATASTSDNVAKDINRRAMDVGEKRAWVAGFGVSEIAFNSAALEKIYIEKARQQLVTRLVNGGCDDPSVIANAWIDANHIRENLGKDELIDYFITPPVLRHQLEEDSIDRANPRNGAEAFINRFANESSTEMDARLEEKKRAIDLALGALVTEQVNRECGAYNVENILKTLKTQAELCDDEMKEEITEREDMQVHARSEIDTTIHEIEDTTGFFSRGKLRDLTRDLCEQVMNYVRLSREIQRRQYARSFYTWFIQELNTRLGRVNTLLENLAGVHTEAAQKVEAIRQNLEGNSFFREDLTGLEIDKVDCPSDDIVFNDFVLFMKDKGGIQAFAVESSNQVGEWMRLFAATLPKAKAYDSMDIDGVLRSLTAEQLKGVCSRAITKALILTPWNYKGFDIMRKASPTDYFYIGVADQERSLLKKNNYLRGLIPGGNNVMFADTGVRDRVIVYHQLSVIPPFTLESIEGYEAEYNELNNERPGTSHWDKHLYRKIKDEYFRLWPRSGEADKSVMEKWVAAVLFGLVKYNKDSGEYTMRSFVLGGEPVFGGLVSLGKSRKGAFAKFAENFDTIKPELEEDINEKTRAEGEEFADEIRRRAKAACRDSSYVEQISGSPVSLAKLASHPEEKDVLNDEINYIMKNF